MIFTSLIRLQVAGTNFRRESTSNLLLSFWLPRSFTSPPRIKSPSLSIKFHFISGMISPSSTFYLVLVNSCREWCEILSIYSTLFIMLKHTILGKALANNLFFEFVRTPENPLRGRSKKKKSLSGLFLGPSYPDYRDYPDF